MSALGNTATPAGWYPDPHQPAQQHYWNGVDWTELIHQPGQPYPTGPELKAPAGTDWNTPWIWLIVVLPLLPSLLLLFVPWGSAFAGDPSDPYSRMSGSLGLLLSPFYWRAIGLTWIVYGLGAFFAYRDVKELRERGVPLPFHWAFAFISGLVYTIGRSVVVHRRTGDGHQPIWAEIAVVLVGLVVSAVILVSVFAGISQQITSTIPA